MIFHSNEFVEKFKKTPGALSVCESIAIMNIANEAPEGTYIELGTFKGKSALSAIQTLKKGLFYLVEPMFENDVFKLEVFENTRNNIVGIELVADISTNEIPKHDFYSYIFVDSGSHQDGLPLQEVRLVEDRVIPNGIIAFHDYESQFKEVKEAYDYLIGTGKYEPISIDWNTIVNYVRENNLEEGNDTWHHTEMQFPCFVGAVKRKP